METIYPEEYRALQRFVSNLDTEKDSLFLKYFELSEIVHLGMERIVVTEIMLRYPDDVKCIIKAQYGGEVWQELMNGYSSVKGLDKAIIIDEVFLDEGRKLMREENGRPDTRPPK